LPFDDTSIDIVFSDNVAEHLESSEIARILRSGGRFLFKTPNRWHYMPLIASLTPIRFHRWFNQRRGRAEADTFPTLYRANSKSAVEKLATKADLLVEAIERIEGRPEYLRLSPVTYLAGAVYGRAVNAAPFPAPFRILLVATLRKP
jgi:SAM-dependent methyltransferase